MQITIPKSVSIICPTFNRPEALAYNLEGLKRQIGVPDLVKVEVIVADDGSQEPTRELVDRVSKDHPFALHHVWHEDKGFRLAAIRNKAVLKASGEYVIFLDEDCIPFPDWLRNHLILAQQGCFVAGNRVLLAKDFTAEAVTDMSMSLFNFSNWDWLKIYFQGKSNRPFPRLRLPHLAIARTMRSDRWQVLKGCNMGVFREDLVAVNGFDEDMQGWGHEDAHFAVRLIRLGRKLKDGRFFVPVLHLWHKQNDRSREEENRKKLMEILNSSEIRAKRGLDASQ